MNLEELRSVRNTERQKDSLQELRPSFYQDVGEYIGNLEDERDRVADQHEDPFASPEVTRLTDEIETAKSVVEAIYERRMGKLVKQASLAAAGMSADSDGLTDEEEALFSDLVARIEANKAEILSVLDGGDGADPDEPRTDSSTPSGSGPAASQEPPPGPPVDEPPSRTERADDAHDDEERLSVADAMGAESTDDAARTPDASTRTDESAADEGAGADTAGHQEPVGDGGETNRDEAIDRVTVQITADVGSILGVDDREYTLASDDVVTLPEANADPLIERDAAEPLE